MSGPVPGTEQAGVWRTIGRGLPLFLGTVLFTAFVQAATVAPGAVPGLGAGFLALFVVSLLTCVLAVAVLAAGALKITAADGGHQDYWRPLIFAAVWVIVGAAVALLSLYLVPVAIALGLWWLPGLADGAGPVAAVAVFRRPVAAVTAFVASAVLVVLCWVVALLAGLFVGGPLGAFLTWAVIGVAAVVLVVWWTCLYRRTAPVRQGIAPE